MQSLIAFGLFASYASMAAAFTPSRHPSFTTFTSRSTVIHTNDKPLAYSKLFVSTPSEVNTTKSEYLHYAKDTIPQGKEEAFPGVTFVNGKIDSFSEEETDPTTPMRPRSDPLTTSWAGIRQQLIKNFNMDPSMLEKYDEDMEEKDTLLEVYKAMQLARQFEVACNKQYMVCDYQTVIVALINPSFH